MSGDSTGLPSRGAGHGGPARGYSWAPFADGNLVSLRHGAYSPRTIGPLAGELVECLLRERPDLRAFAFAVAAWARAETIGALLALRLDEVGVADAAGEPREKLLRELRAHERRAAEERRNLGLDPASAARLARERVEAMRAGFDLEAVQARGRAAIEGRGFALPGGEIA